MSAEVGASVQIEGRSRAAVLAMLLAAYTFNFIDRQIVSVLAVPIKGELLLTDTQLGLLGGPAFALFYTGLGIPFAMLADRWDRSWIMTAALALWSAATAACGFAANFAQLLLARIGVGVGEAGGVAPAHSLIADLFPDGQRARALGIYSLGIPLGSAFGIVLGGVLASLIDWRTAFFAVGAAGLLLAPAFRFVVRDPRSTPMAVAATMQPARAALSAILGKPAFWFLSLGSAAGSMLGYGLLFWLPSFLVRSHGLTLMDASMLFGAMMVTAGVAGMWSGGVLADHFGRRSRSAYALVPALAYAVAIPFYAAGVTVGSLPLAIALLLIPTALGVMFIGPVTASVQTLVAPHQRATASACYLFVNNLIGLGLGPPLMGWLSDVLAVRHGAEALRLSILAGTVCYVAAALFMLLAARRLAREGSA